MSARQVKIIFVVVFALVQAALLLRLGERALGVRFPSAPSAEELASHRVPLEPMEIRLRIVDTSSEEWRSVEKQKIGDDAGKILTGYTIYNRSPCEIVLPARGSIAFWSSMGEAFFDKLEIGDTLAHEMLHCLRGPWHDDWNKIFGASTR